MNLDSLHKRIDKMLAHIEQLQPPLEGPVLLGITKPHLLTDQELERLQAYVAQVEPKIRLINGHVDLSELTDQELDEGQLWGKLGTALEQEDIEAAAIYRQCLSKNLDALISAFLAIDETSIPANYGKARIYIEKHIQYNLCKPTYQQSREKIQQIIEQSQSTYVRMEDVDAMRIWVKSFPAAAAAA